MCPGLFNHIVWWLDTSVLEDHAASIFKVALKVEEAQSSESNHHTTWHKPRKPQVMSCHDNLKSYVTFCIFSWYVIPQSLKLWALSWMSGFGCQKGHRKFSLCLVHVWCIQLLCNGCHGTLYTSICCWG